MSQIIFIKLGGSLITDKTKPLTDKPELIKQLASEIAGLQASLPSARFIIGTGAGSFGHYLVKQNRMSTSGTINGKQKAVVQIHEAVKGLNAQLVEALTACGATATQISGAEVMARSPKVSKTLSRASIVTVYGDAVVDGKKYRIISTEELFEELARQLGDSYDDVSVIFATSVDGVLDESGQAIAEVARSDRQALKWSETAGYDVTGGMKQKLESAFRLLERAKSVRILNGQIEGNIAKAIRGEQVGTLVK